MVMETITAEITIGGYRAQNNYSNQNRQAPQGRSVGSNPNQGMNNNQGNNNQNQGYNQAQNQVDFMAAAENPFPQNDSVQQNNTNLKERGQKPLMNLQAVEETQVSSIDYDDAAAVDAIFNED